jgi:outer membrane lipoprotein-sorting protein
MRWATFSLAIGLALGGAVEAPEDLLRRSDISTFAPGSFRARLTLKGTDRKALNIEVWRAEGRTLVRFLEAKERGKYLLKRDGDLWFLSPHARKPVRLNQAYKLGGGASLDDVLGTRYSSEYRIVGVTETDGLVALDLEPVGPGARYARVRYVVRRETHRPIRVEFRSSSGRATSSVEFLEWEGERLRPRRLQVTDLLRPKASIAVEITEVSERAVPEALFDLDDASARRALEAGNPPRQ